MLGGEAQPSLRILQAFGVVWGSFQGGFWRFQRVPGWACVFFSLLCFKLESVTQATRTRWFRGGLNPLSCPVAPFFPFLGGCPTKMVFPKKGSFFSRVTEQLSPCFFLFVLLGFVYFRLTKQLTLFRPKSGHAPIPA